MKAKRDARLLHLKLLLITMLGFGMQNLDTLECSMTLIHGISAHFSSHFLDGAFTKSIDFEFGIAFKLWVLADGIYPELSRFVTTLPAHMTKAQRQLVAVARVLLRRLVERTFGTLQRKFQILLKPMELWFEVDIRNVVIACVILHNMMTAVRLDINQEESADLFQLVEDNNNNESESVADDQCENNNDNNDNDGAAQQQHELEAHELNYGKCLRAIEANWSDIADEARAARVKEALDEQFEEAQEQWDGLCSVQDLFNLKEQIVEELIFSTH